MNATLIPLMINIQKSIVNILKDVVINCPSNKYNIDSTIQYLWSLNL